MAPGPLHFLFLGAFGERSGFVIAQDRRGVDAKTAGAGLALTYIFPLIQKPLVKLSMIGLARNRRVVDISYYFVPPTARRTIHA